MKKLLTLLLPLAITIGCINPVSASNATPITKGVSHTKGSAAAKTLTAQAQGGTSNQAAKPKVATVKSLVTGDLMCYATVVDRNNVVRNELGADFEICANKDKYLNKEVSLSYGNVTVNDCQSIEPCGKTRIANLITSMNVIKSNTPRTLRLGSKGEDVKKLQTMLNDPLLSLKHITVDGIFGKTTQADVMDFQRKAHLRVDGIVGPSTWNKLGNVLSM